MAYADGNIIIGTSVDVKGMNEGLKKVETSTNAISGSVNKITRSFSNLGRIAGAALGIKALINFSQASVDAASDLIEVQNVADTAFGDMSYKMENFASTAIEKYGMSELAAKKTGSSFMEMGKSIGFTSEQASNMALKLTALSGDFASFYNISQDYARVAMSAVYTGETETLKRYGIVLTQANLQEFASAQGIQVKVKNMTAEQKAYIRYMYILNATKDVEGDFVRTQDSWANSMRVLQERWKQFLITIGNGLITVLTPVLQFLNTIVSALMKFVNVLGAVLSKLFGIKWQSVKDGSSATGDLANNADDAADAEDKLGNATDKAGKKAKKSLAAWDDLNVLQQNTANGGSSGSGSGGGDFDFDFPDVSTLWEDAAKKFKLPDFDSLFDVGRWVSDGITKQLNSIPWNNVYSAVSTFGSGLAEFLNGLITPQLFAAVGTTLANSLNTVLHGLDSFGTTFDWANFGNSLAAGLNAFIGNIDWNLALDTAKTWGNGIATTLNHFLENTDWNGVGNTVAQAVNTGVAFVFSAADTFHWDSLGSALATSLNGFFNGLNWDQIFTASSTIATGIATTINTFFSSDPNPLQEAGEAIGNALNTAILFFFTLGDSIDWNQIGESIATGVNTFFETFDFGKLADSIDTWVQGIGDLIKGFVDNLSWSDIFSALYDFVSHIDIETIGLTIKAVTILSIGKAIISQGAIATIQGAFTAIAGLITLSSGGLIDDTKFTGLAKALVQFADACALAKGGAGTFTEALQAMFGYDSILAKFSESMSLAAGGAGTLHESLELCFGGIATTIAGVTAVISGGILAITNFIGQWQNGAAVLPGILQIIGGAIAGLGLVILGVAGWPAIIVGAVIAGAAELVIIIKDHWDTVSGFLTGILSWISTNIITPVFTFFSTLFSNIWQFLVKVFGPVANWFNTYVIKPVVSFFVGLGKRVGQIFKGLVILIMAVFKGVGLWFYNNVIQPIVKHFTDLKNKVVKLFTLLWNLIKLQWAVVATWFDTHVITPITKLWDKFSTWMSDTVIPAFKEAWQKACDAVSGFFSSMWEGIKTGLKTAINGFISLIESFVNFITGGINKALGGFNKLVGWGAKFVGVDWSGVDLIPTISIPRLAKGAVIPPNKQFMAMLGDQKSGTNVEAPLDTIVQAMQIALRSNNNQGQAQNVTLQVDGKTLARIMIPYNLDELHRRGYNVSVLEG